MKNYSLPKGFQYGKLGDVIIDVRNGVTYPQNKDKRGVKVTRIESVQNYKIDESRIAFIEDIELIKNDDFYEAGDIVLSHINSFEHVGKTAIVEEANLPLVHGMNILRIKLDQTKIFPKLFLYYSRTLAYRRNIEQKINKSVNQVSINKRNLLDIKVPLFPIKYQLMIIESLDAADTIIQKRKKAIAKLDELEESLFLDMINLVIADNQFSHDKLGNYIDFMTSGSRGWAQYYSDSGELFITIKNVRNGVVDLSDTTYINAPKNKESERTKVKEGDLLISITADLGRTAVVDEYVAKTGAYINQHLCLVRLDGSKINPLFISFYLESYLGKRQFKKLDQVGVKSGLNFNAIRGLDVLIPQIRLQIKFADRIYAIRREKKLMYSQLSKLEENFQSILHQAFTGQLQFREEKVNDYAFER